MIVVIFTGGTISMRHDPAAGGAVPALAGRDIIALIPGIERIAQLEVEDFGAFPGPHMTVERAWALRGRIAEHLARAEVDGVVVTHGTDALEESAYLVARSLGTDKPIVFTGAMRTSSDPGWDGPSNLTASVRVAAHAGARALGVLVVMAEQIFTARDVTKVETHMLDAFASPGLGPLGTVEEWRVIFHRAMPNAPSTLAPSAPAQPVDIVYAWAGADSRLLDASRATAKGVVIGAMGCGNVPVAMVEGIDRWIADGKPVIVASRVPRGGVGPTYGYAGAGRRLLERGALFAGNLRPAQARIDLMLALGAGVDLRTVFDD